MQVLVVGGGILGVASAWFLRQDGHEVTLIERRPGVAQETSRANGGQISVSHAEPWANPSAPLQILRWLGRADAPLLYRPRWDAAQWSWALRFLRECLPGRSDRNIRDILRLALYSRAQLQQLRAQLGLEYAHLSRGILHFYTNEAAWRAALPAAALMRSLGCERRVVSADEAVQIEPALAPLRGGIVGADYCAEDESGDASRFTQALAARAAAAGVRLCLNATVTRLLPQAARAPVVELLQDDGSYSQLRADAVVVAAGVESAALLRPLGLRLPLIAAKGYSATFQVRAGALAPTVSLTDDEYKLVFSRLGERLRVAGTAEIGSDDRTLNSARCEAITRRARQLFADACDYEQPQYWSGLRPLTPSNVPLVGATRLPGLYVNTGHGTLGWTMGVGCGRLIADVVSGRSPAVALPALP